MTTLTGVRKMTTVISIRPSTNKSFIPRFFNDEIIVWLNTFLVEELGGKKLPIINKKFIATRSIINISLECWFNSNSSFKDITIIKKDGTSIIKNVKILDINDKTILWSSLLGVKLSEDMILRFSDYKKLIKIKTFSEKPIFKKGEENIIFIELEKKTDFIKRRCGKITTTSSTDEDIKAINKMVDDFKKKLLLLKTN